MVAVLEGFKEPVLLLTGKSSSRSSVVWLFGCFVVVFLSLAVFASDSRPLRKKRGQPLALIHRSCF